VNVHTPRRAKSSKKMQDGMDCVVAVGHQASSTICGHLPTRRRQSVVIHRKWSFKAGACQTRLRVALQTTA